MNQNQQPPDLLLHHHLKALRLPVFLSDYRKVADQCAADKADYAAFLLRLAELELIERETHLAVALGRTACQRGYGVRFFTAAGLVNALAEARNEKALLRLQAQLARIPLLIVDELGYVPFSKTGAELLFEIFSQRYERGSILVTSNLPFEEWTTVLGSERLTAALLDRLTHHVHILPIEGESYRLTQSKRRRRNKQGKSEPKEDKS
jgi:hypothetical protein